MKINQKIGLVFVILLVAVFLIYLKGNTNKEENINENSLEEVKAPIIKESVRYFSPNADKIVIESGTKTLHSKDNGTKLDYYAVDSAGNKVVFREKDRAFTRILGVTSDYTNNTEIFHPEVNDIKDYTTFSGNIVFSTPGTYLIKVCLGESINLNSAGALEWPWGCFEDQASLEIKVS